MKHILLALATLILLMEIFPESSRASTAIVNNHSVAGKAEDSLCVTFFVTDTIGNFSAADSFYVVVFSPWGDSVFGASYAGAASEIRGVTVGGRKMYRWLKDVADIDGPSPRSGTYAGVIVAVDTLDGTSAAHLDQAFTFSFVLEPSLGERAKIGDSLLDGGITAAKFAANAITANGVASDAWSENWSSASRTLTTDSFVVDMSSFNASLDNDTSLVNFLRAAARGGSGGNDSSSIARWVWNSPHSNHTVSGTFGKYLDAQLSGLGSGSGAYACTLVAYDSVIHQVVPGAALAVRNAQQTSLYAATGTNIEGKSIVNLNSGSFAVIATAPGYLFAAPQTIEVSGPQTDTIFGFRFDPGLPSSPSLCRVFGYIYGVNRQPERNARISTTLPSGVARSGNLVVSPFAVSTTTDTLGYFFLDLIPSDSLVPNNAKYEFSITRSDGTILRQRVKVPASGSWQLTW